MLYQSGVIPSQLDEEDYFQLLEIQKAKPREDRPMNTTDAHKALSNMFGGG